MGLRSPGLEDRVQQVGDFMQDLIVSLEKEEEKDEDCATDGSQTWVFEVEVWEGWYSEHRSHDAFVYISVESRQAMHRYMPVTIGCRRQRLTPDGDGPIEEHQRGSGARGVGYVACKADHAFHQGVKSSSIF